MTCHGNFEQIQIVTIIHIQSNIVQFNFKPGILTYVSTKSGQALQSSSSTYLSLPFLFNDPPPPPLKRQWPVRSSDPIPLSAGAWNRGLLYPSLMLRKQKVSYAFLFFALILGSTPILTYKKLIEFHKNGQLSFKYVKTFNMDEYCGKIYCYGLPAKIKKKGLRITLSLSLLRYFCQCNLLNHLLTITCKLNSLF